MTNDADGAVADPNAASPELVALVAKREAEMRGKPAASPVPAATSAKERVDSDAVAKGDVQAEEVEAEGAEAAKAPEEGKPDAGKKALDVEWAKSDALKRRLSTLHEAGHVDEELLGLIRTGVERKEHLRAANKKFEEATEKVKAANAERDQYRERAERYDRMMAEPKFHAAMHATEAPAGQSDKDWLEMTPEERRDAVRREARAEIEAEKQAKAEAEAKQTARIREIEGWATDHKDSLSGTVSDEEYEAALKTTLSEMLEEEIDPRQALTQKGLVRRVNRVLDRQREDREVQSLRDRVDESKRDVVRSARASSPSGVRTQVEKVYATPQAKRIAETLQRYPVRPD
jgi:hypothetical protein